jgi:hypothetical protein
MITTVHNLESVLVLDFVTACSELAEARLERSRKDTPGNRAAVVEVRARIDAMLDMYLAVGGLRR